MKTKSLPLLVMLTLTACTFQVSTEAPPSPTLPPTPTSELSTAPAASPTPATQEPASTTAPGATNTTAAPSATPAVTSPPPPPVTGVFNPYAVVLVAPDDVLNVRAGAGVENAVAGALQPTASGVIRTGPAASAGGDRWVEIQNPGGGTGWVNSNFLTEYASPAAFCADTRVTDLLDSLAAALLNSDGDRLSSLVSPAHGLDLRLWRYGTAANYTPEEASWAFQSDYVVNWGPAPGSGEATLGTFSAEPLPRLQEVFGADYSMHCNDTLDLATFSLDPWPPEYANINFYTVYKPGTEQYGGLDWRAWIAGIEYAQGKPTLFALIHFQWEP